MAATATATTTAAAIAITIANNNNNNNNNIIKPQYIEEDDDNDDVDVEFVDEDDDVNTSINADDSKRTRVVQDTKNTDNKDSIFPRPRIEDGDDDVYNDLDEDDEENKVENVEVDSSIEALTKNLSQLVIQGKKYAMPSLYDGDIFSLTIDELVTKFNDLYENWFGAGNQVNPYVRAHSIFGLEISQDGQGLSEQLIDMTHHRLFSQLADFHIAFEQLIEMDDKAGDCKSEQDSPGKDYQYKFNRMYGLLYNSYHMLVFNARVASDCDEALANVLPEKPDLLKFRPLEGDLNERERLHLFILKKCAEKRYRKKGEVLYEMQKIRNKKGKWYNTHYWKRVKTIQQFMIEQCEPRTNMEMWRALATPGNLKHVAEMISKGCDRQLPDLVTDRTVSAWKNGIFFAEMTYFHHYHKGELPNDVCATVYIDQVFDNADYGEDYMDIPCVIKKILSDQDYNRQEQSFILAMLGRLVFKPGKYDRWEIIPFLWGLAQTGKSSIIECCMRYFNREDVAGVGNSIEKQFGLSPLIGKNLWVANDVKKNFGLDAGDIQTMTSLELMSVAIKYKDAVSVEWDVPGIIAGNEIPKSWTDTLKALARRIMIIDFPKSIKRDNSIKLRLEQEMSLFYRITVYAYFHWQKMCGDKNIWDYAPQRFKNSQKIVQEHENPIEIFLNSKDVQFTGNRDDYVSANFFNNWFRLWCSMWGHHQKLSHTEMRNILLGRGAQVEFCTRPWNREVIDRMNNRGSVKELDVTKLTCETTEFFFGLKLIPNKHGIDVSENGLPISAKANTGRYSAGMSMGNQYQHHNSASANVNNNNNNNNNSAFNANKPRPVAVA